ncbi:phosphotransferase [Streptomyces sp. H27-H1]|nr:phosphotransferase [Streptomyces sp. H27-H1]
MPADRSGPATGAVLGKRNDHRNRGDRDERADRGSAGRGQSGHRRASGQTPGRRAVPSVDGAAPTPPRPGWDRPPVWFHGDFHTGNLLTVHGRLSAVIDSGGLGIGDPACDLTIAFTLLSASGRAVFRSALGVDDATWARGRGWALATALGAYTWHPAVDPVLAAQTTRQITEALIG